MRAPGLIDLFNLDPQALCHLPIRLLPDRVLHILLFVITWRVSFPALNYCTHSYFCLQLLCGLPGPVWRLDETR
jgi:hypothetical protein